MPLSSEPSADEPLKKKKQPLNCTDNPCTNHQLPFKKKTLVKEIFCNVRFYIVSLWILFQPRIWKIVYQKV